MTWRSKSELQSKEINPTEATVSTLKISDRTSSSIIIQSAWNYQTTIPTHTLMVWIIIILNSTENKPSKKKTTFLINEPRVNQLKSPSTQSTQDRVCLSIGSWLSFRFSYNKYGRTDYVATFVNPEVTGKVTTRKLSHPHHENQSANYYLILHNLLAIDGYDIQPQASFTRSSHITYQSTLISTNIL